ncbi:MAG: hypothetical protein P1V35_17620, partial [Planctomycetota bacterium]|nr:hypothetical protein [Planctomycetota bacterium]
MTTDPNNTPSSGESEDLFDFPLVGAYANQEVEPGGAPAEEPQASPVEAPVAEAAPAPQPVEPEPAAAPATKAPAPVAQDASALDEDLFNFDTLFEASQP